MPDPPWHIRTIENSTHFEKAFRKLPRHLQQKTVEKVKLFKLNPKDPRLDTHKLKGRLAPDWAFSIDYHNRVRFRFVGEGIILLIDVGSHDIYR